MALSDLIGTRWVLNNQLSTYAGGTYSVKLYTVDIVTDEPTDGFNSEAYKDSFSSIFIGYNSGIECNQVRFDSTVIAYGNDTKTLPDQWRDVITIPFTITGGTDATNSALIAWLEANATQQQQSYDVTISYKGSQIATMSSSGTKTLLTSGKYCTDNIIIDYTKTGITVVETLDSHGGTIVSISGDPVTLQTKTIMPTASTQIISPDSGYNGFASVIVNGDSNLISSNIASGVSIFGVVGTFAGGGGGSLKDFIEQHGTMTSFTDGTISVVGTAAFAYCFSLRTVSLPSCTIIGTSAFAYCYSLTTASFPACTSINSNAFIYCSRLTTMNFPSCTSIGTYAFNSCSRLTTVSFPSCTTIGPYAFTYCYSLTTASFPACTTICSNAFQYCTSLTTASFPSCTTISSYAFTRCYNLTNAFFPVCTTIGDNAFQSCSSLTTIDFPSCTTLGNNAFAYCSGLRDITLPACKHIKAQAFFNCFSLMSIRLFLCETISSSAFFGCRTLLSVRLAGPSVVYLASSNAFSGTPILGYTAYTYGEYGSIFVPSSLYNAYINDSIWSVFSSRFVRY